MVVLTKQTFLIQLSYNYTVFSKIYDNLLQNLLKSAPGIEKKDSNRKLLSYKLRKITNLYDFSAKSLSNTYN